MTRPTPHRSSRSPKRALAAQAEESGVAAIRLAAGGKTVRTLDPSVVAAYLAGVYSGIRYFAEIPTTHNAPYNVARRALSLDRPAGARKHDELPATIRPFGAKRRIVWCRLPAGRALTEADDLLGPGTCSPRA